MHEKQFMSSSASL